MYRTRIRPVLTSLVLIFALAACSDSATGPDSELAAAEVAIMMEALMDATGGVFLSIGSGLGFDTNADFPTGLNQTIPWNDEYPCGGGGSVQHSGSITISSDFSSIGVSSTETHRSCRGSADDGSTWTFNGNPNLQSSFQLAIGEQSYSLQGSQQGGLSWNNSGRSGSCQVNLSYSMSIQPAGTGANVSVNVNGSVCGTSVAYSGSDFVSG